MASRAARFSEALNKLNDAYREIEEIKDELDNWKSGMEGTNLESTEKYSQLEEAVDIMTSACDNVEGAITDLEGVEIPGAFGR